MFFSRHDRVLPLSVVYRNLLISSMGCTWTCRLSKVVNVNNWSWPSNGDSMTYGSPLLPKATLWCDWGAVESVGRGHKKNWLQCSIALNKPNKRDYPCQKGSQEDHLLQGICWKWGARKLWFTILFRLFLETFWRSDECAFGPEIYSVLGVVIA